MNVHEKQQRLSCSIDQNDHVFIVISLQTSQKPKGMVVGNFNSRFACGPSKPKYKELSFKWTCTRNNNDYHALLTKMILSSLSLRYKHHKRHGCGQFQFNMFACWPSKPKYKELGFKWTCTRNNNDYQTL